MDAQGTATANSAATAATEGRPMERKAEEREEEAADAETEAEAEAAVVTAAMLSVEEADAAAGVSSPLFAYLSMSATNKCHLPGDASSVWPLHSGRGSGKAT